MALAHRHAGVFSPQGPSAFKAPGPQQPMGLWGGWGEQLAVPRRRAAVLSPVPGAGARGWGKTLGRFGGRHSGAQGQGAMSKVISESAFL